MWVLKALFCDRDPREQELDKNQYDRGGSKETYHTVVQYLHNNAGCVCQETARSKDDE